MGVRHWLRTGFVSISAVLLLTALPGCPDDDVTPTTDLGVDVDAGDMGGDADAADVADADAGGGDADAGGGDADAAGCENELFNLSVDGDMTFFRRCSPYVIQAGILGQSGTLTIEPGVEVQLAGTVVFGSGGLTSHIVAEGEEDAPIVFRLLEGNSLGDTRWGGITVGPDGGDSVFRHVELHTCGFYDVDGGAESACIQTEAVERPSTLVLEDVSFFDAAVGLRVPRPAELDVSGLSFDEDTPTGLEIEASNVGQIGESFSYAGEDTINVITGRGATGQVRETATWIDQGVPYRVAANVHVEAVDSWVEGDPFPTLTLDAGLELLFDPTLELRVGREEPGALVITGTEESPVVMDAWESDDSSAQYRGIIYGPGTQDGDIDYLHIRGAGYTASVNPTFGCLTVDGAFDAEVALGVTNSTFEDCGTAGVGNDRSAPFFAFSEFAGNTFVNCPYGLYVQPDVLRTVAGDQTYVDTFANAIIGGNGGRASGRVSVDANWVAQDVGYSVLAELKVEAALSIEGPVRLNFAEDTILTVGDGVAASLIARSLEDEPVVFSSLSDARGGWHGIVFYPDTVGELTLLQNVLVQDGGAPSGNVVRGCITVRGADTGAVELAGVEMLRCEQAGLAAEDPGVHFNELSALVFTDIEVGMSLHPESVGAITEEMTYSDVDRNEIVPATLTTDATWIAQAVPWRVGPSVNASIVSVEAALTLEAGFTLEFLRDRPVAPGVEVGMDAPGALIANGTEFEPVVFRSAEETPASDDWGSIEFGGDTGAGTDLVYVSVSNAGAGGRGVFRLTDTAGNVRIESPELDSNTDPTVLCRGTDAPELISFPGGAVLSGCP